MQGNVNSCLHMLPVADVMHVTIMIGDSLTNPMAVQNGLETVRVTWTEPRVFPGNGYQITTIPSTSTTNTSTSPQNIVISTPGVYTIQLISHSQHFPIETVEVTGIMVLGKDIHKPLHLIIYSS